MNMDKQHLKGGIPKKMTLLPMALIITSSSAKLFFSLKIKGHSPIGLVCLRYAGESRVSWAARQIGWDTAQPEQNYFIMCMLAVYRIQIRIHRIQMFLRLPHPDPLVRGMDQDPKPAPDPELAPDPDPSIILLSASKNSKKNLDFYCFVTSFGLFIFEKLYKCTFKK
jgi:hypothetical protein